MADRNSSSVRRLWSDRRARWRKLLGPPAPLVMNPAEPGDFPLGRWNLYIGGAGAQVPGYVNVDLFPIEGVTVAANAEQLPFCSEVFTRVECDAVLEHVRRPDSVLAEIERVLAPGGYAHIVAPFCHPFHAYPSDYRRFTPEAVRQAVPGLIPVAEGWRTGPAATWLVVTLEFFKLLLPWRAWRIFVHGLLGWLLFPLRYLDLVLLRRPDAYRLGNHFFLWLKKPGRNDLPH